MNVRDKRALTVGSLIPGSMIPKQASAVSSPVLPKQEYSRPAKIIVLQNDNRFEIQPAKGKLLDIALEQGKPLQYKCREGTCGKCTVKIIGSESRLSAPNQKEQNKLKNVLTDGFRLACQAEIL